MTRIEPNRPRPAVAPSSAAATSQAVSGTPAAKAEAKPKDSYVSGKAGQAPAQTDPLEDLSKIKQQRSERTQATQAVEPKELSRDQMLEKARAVLVKSFEEDFVPTENFQDTFSGAQWPELKDRVQADARTFGADPNFEDSPEADGGITFVGHIYGLYTEVTVRKDGKVDPPYFEID